jgi:hypothetical protein
MTLLEAAMASLVLMLATTAAGQLWSQGVRISGLATQREERLHALEALLLASEGTARHWAAGQGPSADCQAALGQLTPLLRALPNAQRATLFLSSAPQGTVHVRWELDGLRRERLWSAAALGLCGGEASDAP